VITNLYPNPLNPYRAPFNRQEFRSLAERHEVSVISPIAWTDELQAARAGKRLRGARRRVDEGGIDVIHPRYVFTPRAFRSWYGEFFRASVRRSFEEAVASFRPELVYAPWAYPDGWAAVQLAREAGLPVVLKVHGSDIRLVADHPDRIPGTREALVSADAVVAVSRDLAERVVALGAAPNRVRLIYGGIDTSLFHPGPRDEARARLGLRPDGPVLLFVGNLVAVKGVDVLIQAVSRLIVGGMRPTCYLIGQGPLGPTLDRQALRLGIADRVHRLGPLPLERLPDWYRAADLLVLPSHSEGLPSVLSEAVACGTPYVATRVGGVPEIAHLGCGRLVPPGNAAALALAILEAIEDPSPRVASSRDCCSYGDVADDLTVLFEKVVRRRALTALSEEVVGRRAAVPHPAGVLR
jgi:glycosyltransferase involved in cell wall biosynthesis